MYVYTMTGLDRTMRNRLRCRPLRGAEGPSAAQGLAGGPGWSEEFAMTRGRPACIIISGGGGGSSGSSSSSSSSSVIISIISCTYLVLVITKSGVKSPRLQFATTQGRPAAAVSLTGRIPRERIPNGG